MMLIEAMSKFDRSQVVPARVRRSAAAVRGAARFDLLPVLEPANEPSQPVERSPLEKLGIKLDLDSDAICEETTDFRDRKEAKSSEAKLTVYALCATIMLFSFPIGFATLIFNILGGENLRTTSHIMALTGMLMALGMSDFTAPVLAAF